ncbi:hypothetical protein [Alcanivorax sp.]|uniref:hypothetical protein n=1 Tax=Alcanivorax sp. TaxID=1872427 RepID=UPI001ABFF317|nr:hypothetical protein [Alcanivorax sp.]
MQGICRLCHSESVLRESHFIPKFIGKWVKRTGITGYIRESNEVHKRAQDIAKEYWLCGDCEALFSEWEREFANKVFFPFADKGESVASYGEWMSRLCASLSWRTLTYIRSKNEAEKKSDDYNKALDDAERHLEKFLLGEESNLNQYEQHVFPLERIESTNESGLPPNINRYFLRTMSMDIVGNSTDLYVYTKLPCFIVLGVIKAKDLRKMRSSRIAIKHGKIGPREYWWPDGFINYIVEKAQAVSDAYDKIPEKHKASFEEYIRKNPDKAASSKLFEAFTHDHDQFGKKVFR